MRPNSMCRSGAFGKKTCPRKTLDALGIDITYLLNRSSIPRPVRLLKIIIARESTCFICTLRCDDICRMAAAIRGIPAILHEHANLTETPCFKKVADRVLEPYTDIAIAVSQSTADFVVRARLVKSEKVKVVYLGAPHDEFSRVRPQAKRPMRAASWGLRRTTLPSARLRGCTIRRAIRFSLRRLAPLSSSGRSRSFARRRGALRASLERRLEGSAWGIASFSSDSQRCGLRC